MSRMVAIASPRSGAKIDEIALSIIRRFQPEILDAPAPFNIELFFECDLEALTKVETDYRELPTGIHGYTDSDALESVISASLIDDSSQRNFCRSTTAHEAGHALLHVDEFRRKKALLCSVHDNKHISLKMFRESEVPVYRNPEWQAWRFAGALLMSTPAIKAAVRNGLNERQLAKLFQVNGAFVKSRLRALKIG